MLALKYYAFKTLLEEQGIIFSYSGYVSEGILAGLGEAIRQKMVIDETDITTTNKVFSIFVEQVQNIIRYSAEKITAGHPAGRALAFGVITIGRDDGRFFVVGGNLVLLEDLPRLRQRLEQIRDMDRDALKSFYKEKLREGPDDGSRGASIGLIEIARRSSRPILFDFLETDDSHAFFCLKAYI